MTKRADADQLALQGDIVADATDPEHLAVRLVTPYTPPSSTGSPQRASWLGTCTSSVMPMPTAAQAVDVVMIEPTIDTSAAPHPI
jgi:hypothetical protein